MIYDLVIVGGGPAGVAAGVYAARKKIKTALITDSFGGQSLVSDDIENWIGTKSVSGFDLAKMFEEHLRSQEDIEVRDGDLVSKIEKAAVGFKITTEGGEIFETKTVLLTAGSRRRKLGVAGEDKFEGKGVQYCSTCDAPIFKDKVVAVAGGGNSGLEAVIDLLPYASKIYLLHRKEALKGDAVTQEKIRQESKVEIILNAEIQEILGEKIVSALTYKDKSSETIKRLSVQGVFVEIGSVPNSDLVKELVKTNNYGEVIVDHRTQATSNSGIWAAGDVTDVLYKQNNISAGDAIKAVLNIYDYLHAMDRTASKTALASKNNN